MEIWEGLPEEVALLTGVLKGEFPKWMRRVRVFQAQHPRGVTQPRESRDLETIPRAEN